MPISLSSTHAPRKTGEVRSPYDVRIRHGGLAQQAKALLIRQRDFAQLLPRTPEIP